MAYAKILQGLLQRFFVTMGRAPLTPNEWSKLRRQAMELARKEEGIPSVTKNTTLQDLITGPHISRGGPKGDQIWDFSQKRGEVIPFPHKGIRGLMEKGDVTVGKAPKTTKETLKTKKDRGILLRDADEDILRIKRENKEAIERFKQKMDENKPDKFQFGGIAPLVGEPSYAADFYDDRTPMQDGGKSSPRFNHPDKRQGILGSGVTWTELMEGLHPFMQSSRTIEGLKKDIINPIFKKKLKWNELDDYYRQLEMDKDMRDPEDIPSRGEQYAAQGGRIGLAGGGAIAKFIEKLFMKASNDIRQGKGKWKGLSQSEWIKKHDDLTKMLKQWEWDGKKRLPPGAAEMLGMNDIQIANTVRKGGKKLPHKAEVDAQRQDQIMEEAYEEIRGGSGFSGDYKYDADILADSIAEVQGKVYADLPELERTGIYDQALKRVTQNLKAKMDFKKNLKDVEQKIELQMFDPKDRLPNQSGGPVDHDALVQMYLAEGLSYEEAVQAAQASGNLPWDTLKKAEGGIMRERHIFGGSAGLKGMWKHLLKMLSKDRDKPITKFFPKLSVEEKEMLELGKKYTPRESKELLKGEKVAKIEGIDILIERLKNDKAIIARQAKNKAMRDPGLDFLMKDLEKSMSDVYTPHLQKYTDIDKDILQMENIKKNLIMKDRKLNAYGGRIGYAGGGKAGLPAITQGLPQGPAMQQPQMPAMGPQPAGIPGGTIVAQNQMQQAPWMGSQMPQGIGGMPRPQPQGQPRMPFGLGGMSRRAFMKMMAGAAALPFIGKGVSKVAPKAIKETTEVITRGADGMPSYIYDLIEVVKAKGTRDVIEGFKKSDYSTVHSYKGVDVIEDPVGNIKIKSDRGGVATDPYTGKTHEGIAQERHMQIEKGQMNVKDEGLETQKSFREPDEYIEGSVRPDMDGKMKDFEEGLDDAAHLEFKKIADELHEEGFYYPLDAGEKLKGKASGGLAYALGE